MRVGSHGFWSAAVLVAGAALAAGQEPAQQDSRVDFVVKPAVLQKPDRRRQSIDYFITFRWRDSAGGVHAESILAGTLWPQVEETKEVGRRWDRTESKKVWRPAPAFAELEGERKPSDYQLVQRVRERIERDPRYWSPRAPAAGASTRVLATAAFTAMNRAERRCSIRVHEWQSELGQWTAVDGENLDCPVGAMVGLAKAIGRPKAHALRYSLTTASGVSPVREVRAATGATVALRITEQDLPEVACVRGSIGEGSGAPAEWCYGYRVPPGGHTLVVRVHNESQVGDLSCAIEDGSGRAISRSFGSGPAADVLVAGVAAGEVVRIRVRAVEGTVPLGFRCEFRAIPHGPLLADSLGAATATALEEVSAEWERAWRRGDDFSPIDGAFAAIASLGRQIAMTYVAGLVAERLRWHPDLDWTQLGSSGLWDCFPALARLAPANATLLCEFLDRLLEHVEAAIEDPAALEPEQELPSGAACR